MGEYLTTSPTLNNDATLNSSGLSLPEKVREYLEKTGCQYRVWVSSSPTPCLWGERLWEMVMLSTTEELLPVKYVFMLSDNTIGIGFHHFQTEFLKLDESKYYVYMSLNEVMKSRDPNARKVAKKLAPGPVKDCEMAEKAAKKASLKYFGREDAIIIDFDQMGMNVNFKAECLSDEEVLREIEKSANALSEAWKEYLEWYHSERRRRLYERTGLKKEPPYIRRFIAEWPPNTGSPEKDREIVEEVKRKLSRNYEIDVFRNIIRPEGERKFRGYKIYTPKGLLELKNGEITVKKSRRCAS
jgi:hypothetical protein